MILFSVVFGIGSNHTQIGHVVSTRHYNWIWPLFPSGNPRKQKNILADT